MAGMMRLARVLAWSSLVCGLALVLQAGAAWRELRTWNAAIAAHNVTVLDPLPAEPALRYAAGWQHAADGDFRAAVRRLTEAEASPDPALAAQAKVALGNLYLQIGLRASDLARGGAHNLGNVQLDLAREAYRSALRLQPALEAARYNLELVERLGPPGRTEAWRRSVDGAALQPFKRDGWSAMRDNPRRGLP